MQYENEHQKGDYWFYTYNGVEYRKANYPERRKRNHEDMVEHNAFCYGKPGCKSYDILLIGFSTIKWDGRPIFLCGECKYDWTCGADGLPYMMYAVYTPGHAQDEFDMEYISLEPNDRTAPEVSEYFYNHVKPKED